MSPAIVGKTFGGHVYSEQTAERAFPNSGEIDPGMVASVIIRTARELDPELSVPPVLSDHHRFAQAVRTVARPR